MKDIIEKQKTTIELIKESVSNDTNDNELKAKLKEKIKELDQANKDKKRLAKDLANAQSKDKDESGDNSDKCSKLTNLLRNEKTASKKEN